ncbi:DUF6953 family protein [Pseudomonas aeruginosa]|uniref:DUF6953 family protein n=1 Tax=Pseudomonas aeruginosa TaxID=287 RepID=UPI0009A31BBA|nr:hypothetical protein [Pseudomonas aeruginosa]NPW62573.1 hypothetical protein [Pseudomonas aeruginosa]
MAWTQEEMQIAEWMLQQFNQLQRLSQSTAARGIRVQFGEQHVYKNKQRNWAINKGILEAFKKLTPDGVVWSRSSQAWRARRPTDPQDSRMVR